MDEVRVPFHDRSRSERRNHVAPPAPPAFTGGLSAHGDQLSSSSANVSIGRRVSEGVLIGRLMVSPRAPCSPLVLLHHTLFAAALSSDSRRKNPEPEFCWSKFTCRPLDEGNNKAVVVEQLGPILKIFFFFSVEIRRNSVNQIKTFILSRFQASTPEKHCVFKFRLNCTEEKESSQNQGWWQRRLALKQELKASGESLLIEKAELSEKSVPRGRCTARIWINRTHEANRKVNLPRMQFFFSQAKNIVHGN